MTAIPADAWRRPPPDGMWRVARDPEALPLVPSEHGPTHRFDDPKQGYAVRYLAEHLEGCLLETMQRFRPAHDGIDQRLAGVVGVETTDVEPNLDQGLMAWLGQQHVAVIHILEPSLRVIDILRAFDGLCGDPDVQLALSERFPAEPHLDAAHVLSSSPSGRALTQALSRAIHDLPEGPAGIQYPSRRAPAASCWALFSRTSVEVRSLHRLDGHNPAHRRAVLDVCARYGISAPREW